MKTFNYFSAVLYLALLVGFTNCGDDTDEASIDLIDISNPNAVTEAIEIENATIKQGNPPAPSTDADAPELYDNVESQAVTNGSSFFLDVDVSSGDIAGVYLKVVGSDDYFDILKGDLATNGRYTNGRLIKKGARKGNGIVGRTEEDNFGLEVSVPSNIQPGEFCMEYCVYDSENRVSNIIEVCIEVLEFGGANSSFLTANDWSSVYSKDTYDGMTEIDSVGVDQTDIYNTTVYCEDQSEMEFEVISIYRDEYGYLSFETDGTLSYEGESYSKYLDYDKTNCEDGLVYEEELDLEESSGTWAYDDTKKELIVILKDEEYNETYFSRFTVTTDADLLILDEVLVDTGDESYQLVFEKK